MFKSTGRRADLEVMRQRVPSRGQHGFTLVEVMVAATVLMVGVLGTFVMIDAASRTSQANNARTAASGLGRQIIEQMRTVDYDRVQPSTLRSELRTRPNLGGSIDASGNWVIERRKINYVVETTICTFDDPMDGLAATAPTNACPAAQPVAGAPTETNPDDFRRVVVTLSWKRGQRTQQMAQTAQIVNPSGGLGPRITSFPDPSASQITDPGLAAVAFNATSTNANNLRWSVDDGVSAGDASGGPTAWTFSWQIGVVGSGSWVPDGVYTANAQPFDSRGVPGELRVASVSLNRRVPLPVSGLAGGRSQADGGVVEMDWNASIERDVIGYRVYRLTASGTRDARVCPAAAGGDAVTTELSCTDPTPLPGNGVDVKYEVVAVDRPVVADPTSGTREGDVRVLTVGALGATPGAPVGLVGKLAGGRPQLDWNAPGGDAVGFYRIYRDGKRYARTINSVPQFVDPAASATGHTYRVSAVSPTYNEGPLSDAVAVAP